MNLVAELLVSGVGTLVGVALGRVSARFARAKEKTCVGYKPPKDDANMRTDCRALRSPFCSDGRCAFHCHDMCHCEPDDVSVIGRRRSK